MREFAAARECAACVPLREIRRELLRDIQNVRCCEGVCRRKSVCYVPLREIYPTIAVYVRVSHSLMRYSVERGGPSRRLERRSFASDDCCMRLRLPWSRSRMRYFVESCGPSLSREGPSRLTLAVCVCLRSRSRMR